MILKNVIDKNDVIELDICSLEHILLVSILKSYFKSYKIDSSLIHELHSCDSKKRYIILSVVNNTLRIEAEANGNANKFTPLSKFIEYELYFDEMIPQFKSRKRLMESIEDAFEKNMSLIPELIGGVEI